MNIHKLCLPKWLSLSKIEFANIAIAAIGIAMIGCSTLIPAEIDSFNKKLLSIVGDLGVGLFPTGGIGFILERIQNRKERRERNNKRLAILRLINAAIHGYLNVICNASVAQNSRLKGENVFEIVGNLNEELQSENIADEVKALALLVDRLKMSFGSTDPLFIVADVFETVEIKHFESLLHDGENLLHTLHMGYEAMDGRSSFLSYLQIACLEIPECKGFAEMVSNGDNIYVPNT